MTVIVESKQLKVTGALREFAGRQAQKISKLGKKVLGVRVYLETITKKSNDPQANMVTYKVSVPGHDVVVRSRAVDMYQALVEGARAAARKVRKLYERRETLRRFHHQSTPDPVAL